MLIASDNGGDIELARAEFALFAERLRSDGVTTVVVAGIPNIVIEGVATAGLDVQILVDRANRGEVNATGRGSPEETAGVISVVGLIEGPESMTDPVMQECLEVVAARHPEVEVAEMRSVEPGEPDWAIGIRIACQYVQLFEMIATAAGPELTNESFIEAAGSLGEFSLAAMPFASLGPDKPDADDTVRLGEWRPDAGPSGGFVPLTDVADATL